MLMHTREGTTIMTQQEKVTNETQQRMNNSLRSKRFQSSYSFFPLPLPRHSFFFCSCPSFLDEPREETLATQATWTIIYFKGSRLFDPYCCRKSIFSYLRRAVFIFAPDKPSWAKSTFTRYMTGLGYKKNSDQEVF